MRKLFYSLALCVTSTVASASTLTLEAVAANAYPQIANSSCVFAHGSCAGSLVPTDLPTGGANSYDLDSNPYTVGAIRSIVGDNFFIGVGLNEAHGQGPQSLGLFRVFINDHIVDTYSKNPATVVSAVNPGNSDVDYVLKGFTSLSGYDAADKVQFHLTMPLVNGGPERFYLLAEKSTLSNPTPEPATYALMGAGIIALGVLRSRRRQ